MKDHCVIGRESPNGIGRTWVGSEAEAIAHAQKLLTQERGKPNSPRLFVVKVVKVVEILTPTVVREMVDSDIPEAKKQS